MNRLSFTHSWAHWSDQPICSLPVLSWCLGAVQVVLNNATQETDNPDLRDRAYVYWRLLSTDPEVWPLFRLLIL
jgi:vesicle coat complex subunit